MTTSISNSPFRWLVLAIFLVVVIGVGAIIGISTAPGEWYAGLNKPPFNPPGWIFAPVWLALYVCIAVAGWRTWSRDPRSVAMKFWVGQMLLNWLWSPTFFTLHWVWPALIVILGMAACIIGFIVTVRKIDDFSSGIMVPYLGWVCFATLLNLSIAVLN